MSLYKAASSVRALVRVPLSRPCLALSRNTARLSSHAGILRTGATADEVYALLGPQARATVDAARAHRKRLAGNRALKALMAVMPTADAEALGIKVLRTDDLGNMAVGMFEVPALNDAIAEPPKSAYLRGCAAAAVAVTLQAAGCLTATFPSRAVLFCFFCGATALPLCPLSTVNAPLDHRHICSL